MKKISSILIMLLFIHNSIFSQNNLFIENKNALTISTSYEKAKGDNNTIVISPFYSFGGNIDFGINIGHSLQKPNMFTINPLVYMHLFSDETFKAAFNLAYGFGYKYESASINITNINVDETANLLHIYYLLYYNISFKNLVIQPQININSFIGTAKVSTNFTNANIPEDLERSETNFKIGLAFIYQTGTFDLHFVPNVYMDNNGRTFSIQVGSSF